MCVLVYVLLTVSLHLTFAVRKGKEVDRDSTGARSSTNDAGEWSDPFDDSEWEEGDEEDGAFTYWMWLAQHEQSTAVHSDASSSTCPTASIADGSIDSALFAEKCFEWQDSRQQEQRLCEHFDLSLQQVKRAKRALGLTWLRRGGAPPQLPTADELLALWASEPHLNNVQALAERFDVCARTMRNHLHNMGFSPEPPVPDSEVLEALSAIQAAGWCSSIGANFAEARLRLDFDIVVCPNQIRRCLQQLNPTRYHQRAATAARTRYEYNVAGPRSLAHADAHEKLAKILGHVDSLADRWLFSLHCLLDSDNR